MFRASVYSSMDIYDLFQIPLKKMSSQLVCVWVTNNMKFIHFVRNKLFPDNGLVLIAEWFWTKFDHQGNWVTQLDR